MLKDAAFQDFSHFLNDIIAYAKVTINGSTVKKKSINGNTCLTEAMQCI